MFVKKRFHYILLFTVILCDIVPYGLANDDNDSQTISSASATANVANEADKDGTMPSFSSDEKVFKGNLQVSPGSVSITSSGDSASLLDLSMEKTHSDSGEIGNKTHNKFIHATQKESSLAAFEVLDNGLIKTYGGLYVLNDDELQQTQEQAVSSPDLSSSEMPHVNAPKGIFGKGGIHVVEGGAIHVQDGTSFLNSMDKTTLKLIRMKNDDDDNEESKEEASLVLEKIGDSSSPSPHVTVLTNEQVVFEIGAEGEISTKGGISVESNGIEIESGGMKVKSGDVEIDSGDIKLNAGSTLDLTSDSSSSLQLGGNDQGLIQSSIEARYGTFLTGKIANELYEGTLIHLSGPPSNSHDGYSFIEIESSESSEQKIFSVKDDGSLKTKGDIYSESSISANKNLNINGAINLQRHSVVASDKIIIENISHISFLEIMDDGKDSQASIKMKGEPSIGQVLFVLNSDRQPVYEPSLGQIKPSVLSLFVYLEQPRGWIQVSSSTLSSEESKETPNNSVDVTKISHKDHTHNGQITFFDPKGKPSSDMNLSYDSQTKTLQTKRLDAKEFTGDVLNFRGRTLQNAYLKNAHFINELKHLSVQSFALLSSSGSGGGGNKLSFFDEDGYLKSTKQITWNTQKEEMKVPALSSYFKHGIEIRSNLDMMGNFIVNARLEKGTTLNGITLQDGVIQNTVLQNVTASGLKLGSVEMKTITLKDLDGVENVGKMLEIGQTGKVVASDTFKVSSTEDQSVELHVLKPTHFTGGDVSFHSNDVSEIHIVSGSMKGDEIDVQVRSIETERILLSSVKNNKRMIGSNMALVDEDGTIQRGHIPINQDGSMGDFRVSGTVDFRPTTTSSIEDGDDDNEKRGSIVGAILDSGILYNIENLDVTGETTLSETLIDGSLTVSGSVLGSGPYIDVSDRRLKKNVRQLSSKNSKSSSLQKLLKLEGVSYELDDKAKVPGKNNIFAKQRLNTGNKRGERQIGFIAQEVEKEFPDLVKTYEDGYKGLQYSRFVPVIVEAIKEIHEEMQDLQTLLQDLRKENEVLKREFRDCKDELYEIVLDIAED